MIRNQTARDTELTNKQSDMPRSMNTGERLHSGAGEFVCNFLRVFTCDHAHFILVQVLGENFEYLPKLNNKEWRANSANFLALWVEDVGTTHKLSSMIWMKPFHALALKLICCRYVYLLAAGVLMLDPTCIQNPNASYIRRVIKVWRVPCGLWENYFLLFSDHPTADPAGSQQSRFWGSRLANMTWMNFEEEICRWASGSHSMLSSSKNVPNISAQDIPWTQEISSWLLYWLRTRHLMLSVLCEFNCPLPGWVSVVDTSAASKCQYIYATMPLWSHAFVVLTYSYLHAHHYGMLIFTICVYVQLNYIH